MRLPHEVFVVLHRADTHGASFLILRRTRPGERYWHVVAGALETGETAGDAALREVREEVDLDVRGRLVELELAYSYSLADEEPATRARFAPGVEAVRDDCFAAQGSTGWEPCLNDEQGA